MTRGPDRTEEKLAFLREVGATGVSHTRDTLLDHLMGTRDLVARWEGGSALVDAALFHSVYGSEGLAERLERPLVGAEDRARVRALIGATAERWVFAFAHLESERFVAWAGRGARGTAPLRDGVGDALSRDDVRALANLVVANAIEQLPLRHRGHRRRTRAMWVLRPLLLPGAVEALAYERSPLARLRRFQRPHRGGRAPLSRGAGSSGSA